MCVFAAFSSTTSPQGAFRNRARGFLPCLLWRLRLLFPKSSSILFGSPVIFRKAHFATGQEGSCPVCFGACGSFFPKNLAAQSFLGALLFSARRISQQGKRFLALFAFMPGAPFSQKICQTMYKGASRALSARLGLGHLRLCKLPRPLVAARLNSQQDG